MTQRENSKQTTVVHTKEDLFELLLAPVAEINDLYFVNDDTAWISWNYTEDIIKSSLLDESRNLSLITGAYVVAQARLLLYDIMCKLGDRLLYTDTDSVIFIHSDDPNDFNPSIGSNIGELSDEVDTDSIITEFCGIGAKSYSIRMKNEKTNKFSELSKLKGFQSTPTTKSQLCFDNYKKMIFGSCMANGDGIDSLTIYSKTKNINRRKFFNIVTVEQQKKFGYTFDKRLVRENYTTTPFGYKQD